MPTTSASTAPVHEFSLREVVAEICGIRAEADPALLVEPVLAAIDPADYEEALREALQGYIVTYVVTARHTPRSMTSPPDNVSGGRKIGTPRLAGVSAFLSSREFSPARGEWIHLSDATAEDLRSMAEKREAMAAQYVAKATWYFTMADTLKSHRAQTVGKLPVTIQQRLLDTRPA